MKKEKRNSKMKTGSGAFPRAQNKKRLRVQDAANAIVKLISKLLQRREIVLVCNLGALTKFRRHCRAVGGGHMNWETVSQGEDGS